MSQSAAMCPSSRSDETWIVIALGVGEVTVAIGRRRHQDPGERRGVRADRVGVDPEALDRGERLEEHESLGARRRDRDVEVRGSARGAGGAGRRCARRGPRSRSARRARGARPTNRAPTITRVEGVGAVLGEGPERARQGRLGEAVALRRDPVGEEDLREPGVRAELVGAPRDAPREIAGDGEPLGGLDRGAERLRATAGPRPGGGRRPIRGRRPGTVIVAGPASGIEVPWAARSPSASAPAGARPDESIATSFPSGFCTRAKRSPPTPHMCG